MATFPFSSSNFFQNQMKEDESFNITQEELFAFHEIDRQLFSKLVFQMSHEPNEALQIAGFWLLLERLEKAQFVAALLKFSDNIFKIVVEETLFCLKATESNYPLTCFDDIPLVRHIMGKNRDQVNLRIIHENRVNIILGVDYFINNICLRVFHDLIKTALENRSINQQSLNQKSPNQQPTSNRPVPFSLFHFSPIASLHRARSSGRDAGGFNSTSETQTKRRFPPFYEEMNVGIWHGKGVAVGDISVPLRSDHFIESNNQKYSFQVGGIFDSYPSYDPMFPANTSYCFEIQQKILERKNSVNDDLFEGLCLRENYEFKRSEEKPYILPSERTIFLTFSKGYPVVENELRAFFTRNYGDIIEALYMQIVGKNEQSLYARLVVRDEMAMAIVLGETGRSRFSINGKHVWARKYVLKNHHSPSFSFFN